MDHSASKDGQTGLEGNFQQMKLQDCVYFLRTGNCAFGSKCRYNHPMAEKLQVVLPNNNRDELPERPGQMECQQAVLPNNHMDELPERPGQMECQFFIKTGICKFGPACWYHHPQPKNGLGGGGQVQLNFLGLPLRPGEKDCGYYVQTGSCKYGTTCRFHHPQPTTTESVTPSPNSSMYSPSGVTIPAPVPYQDGVTTWPVARAPYMPSATGMSSPVNFMPLHMSSPQLIPTTGSTPFKQQGQTCLMPSAGRGPQGVTRGISYGHSQGQLVATTGVKGFDSSLPKSTATFLHGQAIFPERPGHSDCHHYMKTGDCKFGMNCKYHHPKDRAMSLPSGLNPMGLPFRPGKPSCPYYVKHGICKFGPVCKFDHPINVLPCSPPYSPSLSSLNEVPVAPFRPESSLISPASISSERLHNATIRVDEFQEPTSDKPDVQHLGNGEKVDCTSF